MSLFKFFLLFILLISQTYAEDTKHSLDYQKFIRFHWKGDLTSHSLTMKIFPYNDELTKDKYNTFLVLYTKPDEKSFNIAKTLKVEFLQGPHPVTQLDLKDLNSHTQYYYSFVFTQAEKLDSDAALKLIQDAKSTSEFAFKTFGAELTPANFTFGAASCAKSGSNSPVFNSLHEEKLDFFLQNGDLNYDDVRVNNLTKYYEAYYKVFSSPNQRKFYEGTPISYVWDDHDFGFNDADGNSPSKPASTQAYKDFVPHSPLKNIEVSDKKEDLVKLKELLNESPYGIFRSFIVGRCMFIILDLRSFLEVKPGEILGELQEKWLEYQLTTAGSNKNLKQVFLVGSIPWIFNGGLTFEENVWHEYLPTKQKIADLIQEHLYKNDKTVMMIGGDAHMIGFDDGRNNEYGEFPVVQAASLDQKPNCKGGPYSHGAKPGISQYGVIEVVDNGGEKICVKIDLKSSGESVIKYDTCHPELYPSTKSFKCHPSWGDFSLMVAGSLCGVALLGGVIAYFWKKARKQNAAMTKSGVGNIKYSGLEEDNAGKSYEMKESNDLEDFHNFGENDKTKSKNMKRKGSGAMKGSALKKD